MRGYSNVGLLGVSVQFSANRNCTEWLGQKVEDSQILSRQTPLGVGP